MHAMRSGKRPKPDKPEPYPNLKYLTTTYMTGSDPASGDSARGAYGARAPGRADRTGSATKGLRAQRIASMHSWGGELPTSWHETG